MSQQCLHTEQVLSEFLAKHSVDVADYRKVPITETALATSFKSHSLALTRFEAKYDTLLFSKLITTALIMTPDTSLLVDLGAGSSIPTLLARKAAGRAHLHTIAVDIDPQAEAIGKHNAELLGLAESYSFLTKPLSEALADEVARNHHPLIVSNPPYVPVPDAIEDPALLPANGGPDGTRYVMDILDRDYPKEARLAIQWGSVTNPKKVIGLINSKYNVIFVQAARVNFGRYTKQPAISEYLYRQRELGLANFNDSDHKDESQLIIGAVLEPRE